MLKNWVLHFSSFMVSARRDILSQLQKEIFQLQGFRASSQHHVPSIELGPINQAFPQSIFPLGTIHECITSSFESAAATGGFIAGILGSLMKQNGVSLWIGSSRTIFPPALTNFGIEPDKIIFIDLHNESEILWVMEESLKCNGLAAVVGEISDINFTQSRRLQLAVEKSRVNGFLFRRNPRNLVTTACAARWKVTPLPGTIEGDLPGVGVTRWNIELLKVRNGKPGIWQLEWYDGRFRPVYPMEAIVQGQQRKAI